MEPRRQVEREQPQASNEPTPWRVEGQRKAEAGRPRPPWRAQGLLDRPHRPAGGQLRRGGSHGSGHRSRERAVLVLSRPGEGRQRRRRRVQGRRDPGQLPQGGALPAVRGGQGGQALSDAFARRSGTTACCRCCWTRECRSTPSRSSRGGRGGRRCWWGSVQRCCLWGCSCYSHAARRAAAGGLGGLGPFSGQALRALRAAHDVRRRGRDRRGQGGAGRDRRVPPRAGALPATGRDDPEGGAADRPSRHGQDVARSGRCRRGGGSVLLDVGVGVHRDGGRRGRQPRA